MTASDEVSEQRSPNGIPAASAPLMPDPLRKNTVISRADTAGAVPERCNVRLSYGRPNHVTLRFQVANVFAIMACVTCGLGWLLEGMWSVSQSAKAGMFSFVMMIATGGLVFIGDTAARPGPRPRALWYAIVGTIGCLIFFTAVDFIRR